MRSRHLPLTAVLPAALALQASVARADCSSPSLVSTCVDADTVWPAFGPTPWAIMPGAQTTETGRMAFGLVTTYVRRPLVVQIPGAAPTPTAVAAISDLVDATALFSYGLARRFDAGLAIPVTVFRAGAGLSPLTSQTGDDLPRAGLRDLRLGASFLLVEHVELGDSAWASVMGRAEIALPTGDKGAFAGDRGPIGIPALIAAIDSPFVFAQASTGARLRGTTDVLGTHVGSQLALGFGVGGRFSDADRLGIAGEAFALPTLSGQYFTNGGDTPGASPRAERSAGAALIPAEWMLSARAVPFDNARELSFTLGMGGPLRFTDLGATTATFRMLLGVRWTPLATPSKEAPPPSLPLVPGETYPDPNPRP